ncbi:MAG TPA: lysophospholipid acyltransferase family protein [Terriglobales bacterium]|nr:lysophospholipid acyltransferase family protein [Terriglobales bacterium]
MRFHYRASVAMINLLVGILRGMEKQGRENIPAQGAVLIASNHVAYLDPPLIGSSSPREFYYMAKKELFDNSLLGWLIDKYNAIPISRGSFDREGIEKATEVLKQGNALLVFPEGTRSKDGILREPKLGVAKLALETGAPIVPARIDYPGGWLKAFFLRRKIKVRFGSPIKAVEFLQIPKNKEGYLKLTSQIMQRIKELREK